MPIRICTTCTKEMRVNSDSSKKKTCYNCSSKEKTRINNIQSKLKRRQGWLKKFTVEELTNELQLRV